VQRRLSFAIAGVHVRVVLEQPFRKLQIVVDDRHVEGRAAAIVHIRGGGMV